MRKINIGVVCDTAITEIDEIQSYLTKIQTAMRSDDKIISWSYDYAIIRLYRVFEDFVFHITVGLVNHDTSKISENFNVNFPKHIQDDVCEFIVTGGKYFDFHGYDGLLKTINCYIGKPNQLANIIKSNDYAKYIQQLCSLRNYAAHASTQSKNVVKKVIATQRIPSAGSWLKKGNRYEAISEKIKSIITEAKGITI